MDNKNDNGRKISHLFGALASWRKSPSNSFDFVKLIPDSIPEVDFDAISLGTKFLGRKFDYPFIITAMTGGHPEVREINHILGLIATKYNIPVEVGSQRAALENPKLVDTFTSIREESAKGFIIGNIGMTQIRESSDPLQMIKDCIDMIHANAISIHLNVMQELLQPEGNRKFSGVLEKIKTIARQCPVPLIIKEVGCGISGPAALRLERVGVQYINVAGYGGTNFNSIELNRHLNFQDSTNDGSTPDIEIIAPPWDDLIQWGVPTVVSLKWTRVLTHLSIIGSGGIRSGVDLVKVLGLGASMGGICGALLPALNLNGRFPTRREETEVVLPRVTAFLDQFIQQFKITLNGLGCSSLEDLQKLPMIFLGTIKEWLENLNLLTFPRY